MIARSVVYVLKNTVSTCFMLSPFLSWLKTHKKAKLSQGISAIWVYNLRYKHSVNSSIPSNQHALWERARSCASAGVLVCSC
jgi:hypothetical protein